MTLAARQQSFDFDPAESAERAALCQRYAHEKIAAAYRKVRWLNAWRTLCKVSRFTEADCARRILDQARKVEGADFTLTVRTLQLWRRAFDQAGVEGLIDRRGGGWGPHDGRSQEAVEHFQSLYRSEHKLSVKTCHKSTLAKAQASGWKWPASYSATSKWLAAADDLAETCARREGRTAYSKRFMPHVEIDYTVLQPGEQYVIDHTRCDFWAREGDVQFRPWLTSMIDARSRRIVGWHLARTPHQDGIIASLRMAFRDCAVPDRLHLDNGRDFLSELLTGRTKPEALRLRKQLGPDWKWIVAEQQTTCWGGILAELGIELVTAIPYSPWSKGLIERWFGTFADQCCKGFATYCGHDPQSKPEYIEEIRADDESVPTLDQAREQVGRWIDLYDRTPHSGIDGAKPLDVWNTAARLRRANDEALAMLLQSRGVYRVGKNGVSFRVSGRTFTYGGSSGALRRYAGRDVYITLDPEDASYCLAYTAERGTRKRIDRLACNQRVPANTPADQLREAVRRLRGCRKVMGAARREGASCGRNVAQVVTNMQREELAKAYRATGTDDARPNIVPVRTGFEGVSRPARSSFEVVLPDAGDLADLLLGEEERDDGSRDYPSSGISDLFCNAKDGGEDDSVLREF